MPKFGFQLTPNQQEVVPRPGEANQPIYTYTWDIETFLGEQIEDGQGPLIYLKECTMPSYKFDVESYKGGHVVYEFPKGIAWDNIKISFYATNGLLEKLQELTSNIWDQDSGIKLANDFMGEVILKAYTFSGIEAFKWTLKNAWIKSLSHSNLTYESSGILNINITLSYTWAELN